MGPKEASPSNTISNGFFSTIPNPVHYLSAKTKQFWSYFYPKINPSADNNIWKKGHRNGIPYSLYGGFDSLSILYNIINALAKLYNNISDNDNLATDIMHNWLTSPWGIAITVIEGIILLSWGIIANFFREKHSKKDTIGKAIAKSWLYLRDVLKGVKNVLRGMQNAFLLLVLLGAAVMPYFFPICVAVIGVSMIQQIWRRTLREERKNIEKDNEEEISKILADYTYDAKTQGLRKTRTNQSRLTTRLAYVSATYAGILNGFYWYAGIATLCVLNPAWTFTLIGITLFFMVSTIITRIHEEYEFQRKCNITEDRLNIAQSYQELLKWNANIEAFEKADALKKAAALNELEANLNKLLKAQQALRAHSLQSPASAVLEGMQNHLAVYGIITAIIIASSLFFAIPPVVLITAVLIGLTCFPVLVAHSWRKHKKHIEETEKKYNPNADALENKIRDLIVVIKTPGINYSQEIVTLVDLVYPNKIDINHNPDTPTLPKSPITATDATAPLPKTIDTTNPLEPPKPGNKELDAIEVARTTLAGVKQGARSFSFIATFTQILDSQGHWRDNPITAAFSIGFALTNASVYFVKAMSSTYGKDNNQPVSPASSPMTSPSKFASLHKLAKKCSGKCLDAVKSIKTFFTSKVSDPLSKNNKSDTIPSTFNTINSQLEQDKSDTKPPLNTTKDQQKATTPPSPIPQQSEVYPPPNAKKTPQKASEPLFPMSSLPNAAESTTQKVLPAPTNTKTSADPLFLDAKTTVHTPALFTISPASTPSISPLPTAATRVHELPPKSIDTTTPVASSGRPTQTKPPTSTPQKQQHSLSRSTLFKDLVTPPRTPLADTTDTFPTHRKISASTNSCSHWTRSSRGSAATPSRLPNHLGTYLSTSTLEISTLPESSTPIGFLSSHSGKLEKKNFPEHHEPERALFIIPFAV
ncbi:MAG: hypothetical protein Q8R79_08050 [Legionellaceae bacterium]|nr:hypothetical protein [Legionellaceae bacterium]